MSPPGDIGSPAELWILSKLLRSLALRPHSVLQPLFGTNGVSVHSELWVPRGSTRRNAGIDVSFSFLYLLCEAQSWRPPSFCSNRNQLWPMPTAPSEPATKWSLRARPQLPVVVGGMQRHTPKSFITYPNPPKLMTQGQDSEGSPRTPIFSGHPALPVPGWGSQTAGWFLGHSDLFKMFVQWWYPSMLKNLKSIVVIIIKQCYGQCN